MQIGQPDLANDGRGDAIGSARCCLRDLVRIRSSHGHDLPRVRTGEIWSFSNDEYSPSCAEIATGFWKTAKFNEESFAEQNLSQPVRQV
jgi:hypothetical protein